MSAPRKLEIRLAEVENTRVVPLPAPRLGDPTYEQLMEDPEKYGPKVVELDKELDKIKADFYRKQAEKLLKMAEVLDRRASKT
jgi:hypothetical protein